MPWQAIGAQKKIPPISKCSQGINEVGPPVTQLLRLLLAKSLHPVISLALSSQLILPHQQKFQQDASSKQTDDHVRHYNTMTSRKFWRLEIDIRTDNPIQISPPNHEAEHNSTLIDSFDIVGHPGYGVCNARINPQCTKESSSVLDAGLLRTKEHRETGYAKEGDADVAETTTLGAICDESDGDRLEVMSVYQSSE